MTTAFNDWYTNVIRDSMNRFEKHVLEDTAADLARARLTLHRKLGLLKAGSVEYKAVIAQLDRVARIDASLDKLQGAAQRLFRAQLSDAQAPRALEIMAMVDKKLKQGAAGGKRTKSA